MTQITPRWEWRSFGRRFGQAEERLARLTPSGVQESDELYRSLDADARRAIVGLQPKRAEVILAGACIVRAVMEKLGKQRFTVSDRGLRHGAGGTVRGLKGMLRRVTQALPNRTRFALSRTNWG